MSKDLVYFPSTVHHSVDDCVAPAMIRSSIEEAIDMGFSYIIGGHLRRDAPYDYIYIYSASRLKSSNSVRYYFVEQQLCCSFFTAAERMERILG